MLIVGMTKSGCGAVAGEDVVAVLPIGDSGADDVVDQMLFAVWNDVPRPLVSSGPPLKLRWPQHRRGRQ